MDGRAHVYTIMGTRPSKSSSLSRQLDFIEVHKKRGCTGNRPMRGISEGIMAVTDPPIIYFFIYRLTLQMGYIDRPVDWLQYALKIRAGTIF